MTPEEQLDAQWQRVWELAAESIRKLLREHAIPARRTDVRWYDSVDDLLNDLP